METREFRKRLLVNQKLLEDLSIAIDRVLQEHKVKLREGMTYAFVPIVFEKPKMIHEISNWCDSRTNMVAILEPSLVKALGKLRVEEIRL